MKLNDQQRAMVERNMGIAGQLAGRFWSTMHHKGYDRDDLMSIAVMGMCRAAAQFDASLGLQESTYLYHGAKTALLGEYRKLQQGKRSAHVCSLNARISGNEKGQEFEEIVPDQSDMEGLITTQMTIRHVLANSRPEYRKAFVMAQNGKRQMEIASTIGCSQANVCRMINAVKCDLRRQLYG